ncbi:MAG: hypothetical protein A3K61_07900 [Thaumarchaeota archaeon RBG_16_49_8]|nr:hypothetical protein [Nitrososphaerota archaeon]OHE53158.1 MAG: hypothetical protein A3K61_07900 [Thaumarchaeota archaeon RBG_16_49_8]
MIPPMPTTHPNISASHPHASGETAVAKRKKLSAPTMLLGAVLLALGFYIMPGSRKILMENQELSGFMIAILGVVVLILAFFLSSYREERILHRLR